MAKVVPGFGALPRIDETRREFTIAGRTFHEARFATPDGRARFHPTPLPDFVPAAGEPPAPRLRSRRQPNTGGREVSGEYRAARRLRGPPSGLRPHVPVIPTCALQVPHSRQRRRR